MRKYFSIFLFFIFLVSCNSVATSDYIVSTSEGKIGVKMPLFVNFADTLAIDNDKLNSLVSINPRVDYKCTLRDNNTLVITPVTAFDYGTNYEVSLDLAKLSGGKEKGKYVFKIVTAQPDYIFQDKSLVLKNENYTISGEIYCSDYVSDKYIEQNFTVKGTNRSVKWEHADNGRLHIYSIDSLESKDESYTIRLERRYHGKNNDIEVEIPKIREYKIIDCKVIEEPFQVVVSFSSKLRLNQRFSELITMDGDNKFNVVDNNLIIYPENRITGKRELIVSGAIEDINGNQLANNEYSFELIFPEINPSIKLIGKGSILPSSGNSTILFQSVNYAQARIRVKKIYSNNILQFFQRNTYDGSDDLDYVSKIVKDTIINLDFKESPKLRIINNYALNLTDLIAQDKGAIYRIEIRGLEPLVEVKDNYEYDYYFGDYRTYSDRSRNILQSNLGIIAKGNDNGNYTVFVTDLLSAKSVSDCEVKFYNKVNQQIAVGLTGSSGKVELNSPEEPSIIIATKAGESSYLQTDKGLALSLSNFDVAGTDAKSGIKGYLFGERGVWRPGDDIYLTFMVMSTNNNLPENHPASIYFHNPQGQLVSENILTKSKNGIYTFKLKTQPNAPTGNWMATVDFGGEQFKKTIKIETIKPNRLKIDFRLNDKPLLPASNIVADINATWLQGSVGKNLKVKVDVELSKSKTEFEKYPNYSFDDGSIAYKTEEKELFSGVTNDKGDIRLNSQINGLTGNTSGVLNAKFSVKVFEPSGDFSIDQYTTKLSPYDTYVGVYVEEQDNDWGEKYLDIKDEHIFRFVAVNKNGAAKNIQQVKVDFYKIGWDWWWDSASENALANYAQNSYNIPFSTVEMSLENGVGQLPVSWKSGDWGLYLVRVTDLEGGHSATKVCFVNSSYDNGGEQRADAATKIAITKDKEKYSVGEQVTLTIPSAKNAKALVSLESGNGLLRTFWVDCESGKTDISFQLEEEMAPNIYAFVTMIQPYNNTINDAPMRMYGVVRINVENKKSRITPVLEVADKVRPETEFNITVSEKNGVAMSYVLAIVDDGLLDLTRFKTPDPWGYFNANEALGVRSWDLYDNVIGAYGGRIEQLFAIGGDDEILGVGQIKAERFKPVVHFIDPQHLEAGQKAVHKVKLPPYFGSVRVMVIASNGKAQGSAEKRVAVKKPLLVQATMPRVISTDEEITVPVTIFAMEDKIGEVTVEAKCNEFFTIVGEKTKKITINENGERMLFFNVKASNNSGIGTFEVNVKCANDNSTSKIEIDVRNPNPMTTFSKSVLIKGGESVNIEFPYKSKSSLVEISTIPAIDLSNRLNYLTSYPHGCIEQIVSGAFPQLFINDIMACESSLINKMEYNVKSTLDRLNRYQLLDGSFSYWSGSNSRSVWGTIYAAHFIIEAQNRGYKVNVGLKEKLINYLKNCQLNNNTEQAYALYVLSLNGTPNRGMMNRMRDKQDLVNETKWLLAGAYALDNKAAVAQDIISKITSPSAEVSAFNSTFGSREREMAITLNIYTILGDKMKCFELVKKLAEELNNRDKWMSTQTVAWSLNSIAKYLISNKSVGIDVNIAGENIQSPKSFIEKRISTDGKDIKVRNNSSEATYAVVSARLIPDKGTEKAQSNGLSLNVKYVDFEDNIIDPKELTAATDFFVEVSIRNTSKHENYTNLALTHIFPSGWEITNNQNNVDITYQDVRDDRVLSYFDLRRGEHKTIRTKVTATYIGKFYLPSIYCEAMYKGTVNASTLGGWVKVK